MHKSISSPNLGCGTSCTTIAKPGMSRNISVNSLADMTALDAIMITKAPIHQAYTCLNSSSTPFPETLLNRKADAELLNCLITPCDPDELKERSITPSISSAVNRTFLQLAIEDKDKEERYVSWMRRLRKKSDRTSLVN